MKKNIRRLKMMIDCRTIKSKTGKYIYWVERKCCNEVFYTKFYAKKNSRLEKAVGGSVAWWPLFWRNCYVIPKWYEFLIELLKGRLILKTLNTILCICHTLTVRDEKFYQPSLKQRTIVYVLSKTVNNHKICIQTKPFLVYCDFKTLRKYRKVRKIKFLRLLQK